MEAETAGYLVVAVAALIWICADVMLSVQDLAACTTYENRNRDEHSWQAKHAQMMTRVVHVEPV